MSFAVSVVEAAASQLALDVMLLAILLALIVGLSLGLLGGGGSILMVPILRYVLELEGHGAIATSLFIVGTTSGVALIAHARRGHVQWRTGFVFGASGMLGAYLAGQVAQFLPAPLLLIAFSAMMLATAYAMLRGRRAAGNEERSDPDKGTRSRGLRIVAEGLTVGAVTGFVGAGGGFLVVPALVLLGGVPMQVAVGTSLLVIALKSFAGLAGYIGHTPLDWGLALALSAAAIVGSLGGGALARFISPELLRRAFGWFVVAMAFFVLGQEVPALWGQHAGPGFAALAAVLATSMVVGARSLLRRCHPRPWGAASRLLARSSRVSAPPPGDASRGASLRAAPAPLQDPPSSLRARPRASGATR